MPRGGNRKADIVDTSMAEAVTQPAKTDSTEMEAVDKKLLKAEMGETEDRERNPLTGVLTEAEGIEKKLKKALIKNEDLDRNPIEAILPENVDAEKRLPEAISAPKKEDAQAARIRELRKNSANLWKCEDVPHSGWTCVGVEDLGAPVGVCEMCGYQIIRYVHHMEHPEYRSLAVGCVCAGRMEGDMEGAKRREADFKNRQARHMNFLKRKWKRSKKGNEYLKIDGHIVVLYQNVKGKTVWKYSVDNEFCKETYSTREEAAEGVFRALEQMKR